MKVDDGLSADLIKMLNAEKSKVLPFMKFCWKE